MLNRYTIIISGIFVKAGQKAYYDARAVVNGLLHNNMPHPIQSTNVIVD